MIDGKIGAEIECLVPRANIAKIKNICIKNNWELTTDGSIGSYSRSKFYAHEIKVGVYKLSDLEAMNNQVKELLELVKVNKTCGLHIHISFTNIVDYYKLLNWQFADSFQKVIASTFKSKAEIRRLVESRPSSFCRFYNNEADFKDNTRIQLNSFSKNNRYFTVNYNAYNVHGTVEFRVFPATNKLSKFKAYTNLLLKTVEKHLAISKIAPISFNILENKKRRKEHKELPIFREILTKPQVKSSNGK